MSNTTILEIIKITFDDSTPKFRQRFLLLGWGLLLFLLDLAKPKNHADDYDFPNNAQPKFWMASFSCKWCLDKKRPWIHKSFRVILTLLPYLQFCIHCLQIHTARGIWKISEWVIAPISSGLKLELTSGEFFRRPDF